MTSDETPILSDLETLWSALDSFFQRFSPQDWSRKHGKEWVFADMPYHLAYFNQTVIDGIGNDRKQPIQYTLQELNTWNDARFAQRPTDQAGAKGLGYLHSTQAPLKQIASDHAALARSCRCVRPISIEVNASACLLMPKRTR